MYPGNPVPMKEPVKTEAVLMGEKLDDMYNQIKAAVDNNETLDTMSRLFDEMNQAFTNYMKAIKLEPEPWRVRKYTSEDDMVPLAYLRSLIRLEDYVNKDDSNSNLCNDFKMRISEKTKRYEPLCFKCRNPPAMTWLESFQGDNWKWLPVEDESFTRGTWYKVPKNKKKVGIAITAAAPRSRLKKKRKLEGSSSNKVVGKGFD